MHYLSIFHYFIIHTNMCIYMYIFHEPIGKYDYNYL